MNINDTGGINLITNYEDYPYIVYVRVSTERDGQRDSVPNQIDVCRYWVEQNKYSWSDQSILKDKGKSGTLFLERSAMQLILQKARDRTIKMVVFKSISRLARDLKDALEIKEVLLGHGVRVVTIEEGYDSLYEGKNDMKFEMFAMFAAQYPKSLSVSISAALAAKVRRGEHIGRIPYGYERVDKKLSILEEEAKVIRLIFNLYNSGVGFKNVTHKLNELLQKGEILPPKRGGVWQLTTIQSIIKNSTYCGRFTLNRYTKVKIDGRKKQIQNPKEKWTVFENHHPAIITIDAWEKANNKEVVNKRRKVSPWNEFRTLLRCGNCGYNMIVLQSWKKKKDGTKTRWRYLKCSAYRRAGKAACVNHVPITYEDFRVFIINELQKEGAKIQVNFKNSIIENRKTKMLRINKKINDKKHKKERLLDIYLNQIIEKREFETKNKELDQDIKKLNDELFILDNEESSGIDIQDMKDAFKMLKNTKADLFHVFKVLIDHATIHPDGKVDIKFSFQSNKTISEPF